MWKSVAAEQNIKGGVFSASYRVAEEEGLYKRLSDLQQANRQTKTRERSPPGSSTLQSQPVSQLREAQPLQESLI